MGRSPTTRSITRGESSRAALLWISWSILGSSCEDGPRVAGSIEPTYPDPCSYAECGAHGTCRAGALGDPECACDPGYVGAQCSSCAAGYHVDVEGACVRDTKCLGQPANLCGTHGSCEDRPGGHGCRCDPGYEGARCNLCIAGYAANEFGECLQLVIWQGMPDGGAQSLPRRCAQDTCKGHGQCSEAEGRLSCACFPGYQGTRCDVCAPGYVSRSGRCVADTTCGTGKCDLCERFNELESFPARPDNCFSSKTLVLAELSLSSLGGVGNVWLCGPSTLYPMGSEHVALEVGPNMPAEIKFQAPVSTLRFDYGVRSLGRGPSVALEFAADGKVVEQADDKRVTTGPLELQLDPPATSISIRSASPFVEEVAIDNLVYGLSSCD
jgi:hypothetical protein